MGEKARGFDKKWIQTYMLIFIVIGLGVILSFISSNFLTVTNLLNVVRQIAVNGILAIGMTIVCLTGGIDLSVGSIVAFSGIIAAGLLRDTSYPIIVVVLAAIAVGAVCGLYNGYFVAYWNAAPFVVTLSMVFDHCEGDDVCVQRRASNLQPADGISDNRKGEHRGDTHTDAYTGSCIYIRKYYADQA